jgi:C-terminal processing protease CtpA/Prc
MQRQRFCNPARRTGLTLLAATVVLGCFSQGSGAQDSKEPDSPALRRLKQLAEEYAKTREAALKEIEEARKKVKERSDRANKALKEARDKDARTAAIAELRNISDENTRLTQMWMAIQGHKLTAPIKVAPPPIPQEARLGARFSKPSTILVNQLGLTKGQGLVVDYVFKDQAAAKAGIKVHDVLLQVNGRPVSTDLVEFRKQLAQIEPDALVTAVVLRLGRQETVYGLKLPAAGPR